MYKFQTTYVTNPYLGTFGYFSVPAHKTMVDKATQTSPRPQAKEASAAAAAAGQAIVEPKPDTEFEIIDHTSYQRRSV